MAHCKANVSEISCFGSAMICIVQTEDWNLIQLLGAHDGPWTKSGVLIQELGIVFALLNVL